MTGGGRCGTITDVVVRIARKNAVPIFLLTGTVSVVITKIMYSEEAEGLDGDVHAFEKPWFNEWVMFLGMVLCVPVYHLERLWARSRGKSVMKTSPKLYWAIILPSLCDLVSTFLINVGLLWISGSIWQMLRGSVIIFTAILKVVYRRRRLAPFELSGMLIVVVGIIVVGISAFLTPGEDNNDKPPLPYLSSSISSSPATSDTGKMIAGICLVIVSQMLAALQTIIEEKLLHDVEAAPLIVVGMEGVWGLLLCSLVSMPIAQHLPGAEGGGLHENTLDSFVMLYHSPVLLGLNIAFAFTILLFNIYGMIITDETDAMVRNLLEPIRTLFIWVAMIFIHYVITTKYGESVNWWSFLQLGGFVILVCGFLLYNAVVRFPCFTYKKKSASRHSAAPPPPLDKASADAGGIVNQDPSTMVPAPRPTERTPLLIEIHQQLPIAISYSTPVYQSARAASLSPRPVQQ